MHKYQHTVFWGGGDVVSHKGAWDEKRRRFRQGYVAGRWKEPVMRDGAELLVFRVVL